MKLIDEPNQSMMHLNHSKESSNNSLDENSDKSTRSENASLSSNTSGVQSNDEDNRSIDDSHGSFHKENINFENKYGLCDSGYLYDQQDTNCKRKFSFEIDSPSKLSRNNRTDLSNHLLKIVLLQQQQKLLENETFTSNTNNQILNNNQINRTLNSSLVSNESLLNQKIFTSSISSNENNSFNDNSQILREHNRTSDNGNDNRFSNKKNKSRFLDPDAIRILRKWYDENQSYPYPNEDVTNSLAKETDLKPKQVKKWFANRRVRTSYSKSQYCNGEFKRPGRSEKPNKKLLKDEKISGVQSNKVDFALKENFQLYLTYMLYNHLNGSNKVPNHNNLDEHDINSDGITFPNGTQLSNLENGNNLHKEPTTTTTHSFSIENILK
ncbi:hypothetical protein SNEBB_003848 [Seison nebaliae]|nr:hypothetical protein SNEBB_003848 [Seison nebaliae]